MSRSICSSRMARVRGSIPAGRQSTFSSMMKWAFSELSFQILFCRSMRICTSASISAGSR